MNPKLDAILRVIEVAGGLVFVGALLALLAGARRMYSPGHDE